jgi:hypothetical protein
MAKNRNLILKSKDPFTKVPNKLRDLGPLLSKEERRIYPYMIGVYVIFAGSSEAFNPSIRYICDRLGCSRDTAQKALDCMVCKNLLRLCRSHVGLRDEYEFTPTSDWKPESRWIPPKKGRSQKDGSIKDEDTPSDMAGHPLSYATGHNNERSPMKETMNDERASSPSFSFQKEEKPKKEKDTDWFDRYCSKPSDMATYEVWVTASEIDEIFSSAQRVFSDFKTRSTFRQHYLPALEKSLSTCFGRIFKQGKVPLFYPEIMMLRLDFYLKQRFKEFDPQKPFMQFDGYICQGLRKEAKELIHNFHRYSKDQGIRCYIENYNPVETLCETLGFSNYLDTSSEVEKDLLNWARLHLGAPPREQAVGVIEYVLRSWIACSDYREKNEFHTKLSILWCDLWIAFSQKAKFLVPDWADRSQNDFYWSSYDDVAKLARMCNTAPVLWAWEEKIKLGEIREDRNTPVGFLEFLQNAA